MSQTYEDLVAHSQHIRPLTTLEGHTSAVRCVAFSPDGRWLATGSSDNTVRLWEVRSSRCVSILQGHTNYVWSVAFSPDGHLLATGSSDATICLWEVSTGHLISIFRGHSGTVRSVAFSPDGRWLATGSTDRTTVRIWDVQSGHCVTNLRRQGEYSFDVYSVAFSPDGRWLASGSRSRTVRLWEVPNWQLVSSFQEQGQGWGVRGVHCVTFSPDGHWLAFGEDSKISLREVPTGRLVSTLEGHASEVLNLAFSPDNKILVSVSGRDGTMRLWEPESGQLISTLSQAQGRHFKIPLAISPDGRLLVTYPSKTVRAIQLWDISALDVGPKCINTASEGPVTIHTDEAQTLLLTQMRTFPLRHVLTPEIAPARATFWLRGAAAAGWPLPLALAYDLGLLLSQPADQCTLAKPTYLPFDEDTSAYFSCLQRLAAHPLVRDLSSWSPPLSDIVLCVLLARLVEGLDLPQNYLLPTGSDGIRFLQSLDHELAKIDSATLWQRTPPDARPSWRHLLTPQALTRLESNLQAFNHEELRFLTHYSTSLLGGPDPRTLLDLLALTGLSASAQLALSQSLRFLSLLSANTTHRLGGIQTYPEGGYEGLARQGSLESLLPAENAYPDDLFLHRILNREALYYGRERPRERRRELVYLVGQLGWGLGGDGQVLVRALLLTLDQAMRQRGYEVLYSLAGATLSEPHPLEKPAEIGRLLYAQERGGVNSEAVLRGVLKQLRAWREDYRGRQVLWILSPDFDSDNVQDHASLYQALRGEGEQQVWYVRVGPVPPPHSFEPPPATAQYFGRWQVVESSLLWRSEKAQ